MMKRLAKPHESSSGHWVGSFSDTDVEHLIFSLFFWNHRDSFDEGSTTYSPVHEDQLSC